MRASGAADAGSANREGGQRQRDPTPACETCPRREAWASLFAALLAVAVPLTGVASLPGEDDGLTAAKADQP